MIRGSVRARRPQDIRMGQKAGVAAVVVNRSGEAGAMSNAHQAVDWGSYSQRR